MAVQNKNIYTGLSFHNSRLKPEPSAIATDNLWRADQVVALIAGKPEKVTLVCFQSALFIIKSSASASVSVLAVYK